jgi:hypothetical protein
MANTTTATCLPLFPSLELAWRDVDSSFERFCLTAGIGAVEQMLRKDGQQLTGAPHSRGGGRVGHRWGTTEGKIGFHGGKVTVHRPPVRSFDGHEVALPSWTAAQAEDLLGRWAMNLMVINVSRPTSRRPKKPSRAQRQDIRPHPLVDPGNPPHSSTSRAKTHSTRRCHRMVALAARSSGRSTEISSQTKITTVMLGRFPCGCFRTCCRKLAAEVALVEAVYILRNSAKAIGVRRVLLPGHGSRCSVD